MSEENKNEKEEKKAPECVILGEILKAFKVPKSYLSSEGMSYEHMGSIMDDMVEVGLLEFNDGVIRYHLKKPIVIKEKATKEVLETFNSFDLDPMILNADKVDKWKKDYTVDLAKDRCKHVAVFDLIRMLDEKSKTSEFLCPKHVTESVSQGDLGNILLLSSLLFLF